MERRIIIDPFESACSNDAMPLPKLTDDALVKRLRWVMLGVILFSILNTLAGQPASFWANPQTAMRWDGLSVDNATNHTFDFFLGHGWQPYLLSSLAYASVALLVVSYLPRFAALTTIFAVIFGHFYGSNNWLVVRWNIGFTGSTVYSIFLAAVIVLTTFSFPETSNEQVCKHLRWIMIAVMAFDFINTLIGQPASFWVDPKTCHEGNQFVRLFLSHGWWAYALLDLGYFVGAFRLVSALRGRIGLICVFSFIFIHFVGASNWFFYEWRLGMEAPVAFGALLSTAVVRVAFRHRQEMNLRRCAAPGPLGKLCSGLG